MNKIQDQAHIIRYRKNPKDNYYTPEELSIKLIPIVPLIQGDLVIDPCKGKGAFYNNYPSIVRKDYFEIDEGKDFLKSNVLCDWIITNPPYSNLNIWLDKISNSCRKGFGLLLSEYAITPKRLDLLSKKGFYCTNIHYVKVMRWYGLSVFIVFEKDKPFHPITLSWDRKIYYQKN